MYEQRRLSSACYPRVDEMAQERARAVILRIGEEDVPVLVFDDLALIHEDDIVRGVLCELHFVRDDDLRHSLGVEVLHDLEDFADQFGVCLLYTSDRRENCP